MIHWFTGSMDIYEAASGGGKEKVPSFHVASMLTYSSTVRRLEIHQCGWLIPSGTFNTLKAQS